MKTKIAAVLAATALVVAGCSSPTPNDPVELSTLPTLSEHVSEYRPGGSKFIGPVGTSLPAPTLSVTSSQSLTDLLMPPTDAQPQEPTKGSLGVFVEDYAHQPVMDQFLDTYLPEK